MVKRAKLRAKLALAIQKWMPSARDPLYLRRHFQRADLASTFGIRRETMITLADWTAAIELVDVTGWREGVGPFTDH